MRIKLRTQSALFVCSLIVGHSFFLSTTIIIQPVVIYHGQNLLFLAFEISSLFSRLSHAQGNRLFLIDIVEFPSDDFLLEFRMISIYRAPHVSWMVKKNYIIPLPLLVPFQFHFIIPLIFSICQQEQILASSRLAQTLCSFSFIIILVNYWEVLISVICGCFNL